MQPSSGYQTDARHAERELLSSHDTHELIAGRLGISPDAVWGYCNHLVQRAILDRCPHVPQGDAKTEVLPALGQYGQQAQPPPGQPPFGAPPYGDQPSGPRPYPPAQQWHGGQDLGQYQAQPPHPAYDQRPPQPSFTPNPQYGTPPGQPAYQAQLQYPPPRSYGQDLYTPGQPQYARQPYSPRENRGFSYQQPPRKRRRVFLWVFLAIQAVFIIWIIVGLHAAAGSSNPAAQAARYCANGGWYPLFKSQADCTQHYGGALAGANDAGTAIGVGLVIAFWVAVDLILGIGYGIYRLARRSG